MAAGQSTRMGGIDKIFAPLLDLPLIAHTLDAFESFDGIDDIVLVLDPASRDKGQELSCQRGYRKVLAVCEGGSRRQDSVKNGLERLNGCSWVIVHDGARPCLDHEILDRGLQAAQETGAALAALPVTDTVKEVSAEGQVVATVPRDALWFAQTPQVFRYELLLQAHLQYIEAATDDATMLESMGHPVKVFRGSPENLKVTTPEDLDIAGAFLRARVEVLPPRAV